MANNLDAVSKDDFLTEEERLFILKTEVESLKELKEHTYLFDGTVDLNVLGMWLLHDLLLHAILIFSLSF